MRACQKFQHHSGTCPREPTLHRHRLQGARELLESTLAGRWARYRAIGAVKSSGSTTKGLALPSKGRHISRL
jgi:hypothetical protein